MTAYRSIKVAILGAGTVGGNVVRMLLEQRDELASRVGAHLDIVGVGVRDLDKDRPGVPRELLTDDLEGLVRIADIVVELIGGVELARTLHVSALESGADVVTGNKALIATHGEELATLAEQFGAHLYYEAAVAGAIPIIRPLRESLAGDRVERVLGIVNGTTNFILDLMHREGASLELALARATELGYAEADPTADIEGYDAAQKATILANLAFHTDVPVDAVLREGITGVTKELVDAASRTGHVVKLLAVAERIEGPAGDEVSARVHPALVPVDHPLAAVHEAKNAIFVTAQNAGDLMFYGAGAGGPETASAVLGDVVSAARRHVAGGPGLGASRYAHVPIVPAERLVARWRFTIDVDDRPGVLADLTTLFANAGVSVESLQQSVGSDAGSATLEIGTHAAPERSVRDLITHLTELPSVDSVHGIIRHID